MTGLNPSLDTILEITCLITDYNLSPLFPNDKPFSAIIHHSETRLSQMDEWCTSTHARTGLTAACIASTTTAEEASSSLLTYIRERIPSPRKALLAGNSIHADRQFLSYAPWTPILDHLHYRILDVSSIKEAARRWCDESVLRDAPKKEGVHRSLEDILESIEEVRWYRDRIFRSGKD